MVTRPPSSMLLTTVSFTHLQPPSTRCGAAMAAAASTKRAPSTRSRLPAATLIASLHPLIRPVRRGPLYTTPPAAAVNLGRSLMV